MKEIFVSVSGAIHYISGAGVRRGYGYSESNGQSITALLAYFFAAIRPAFKRASSGRRARFHRLWKNSLLVGTGW
jgi:hypothetical protein